METPQEFGSAPVERREDFAGIPVPAPETVLCATALYRQSTSPQVM
jgi:hypothetical protein